MLGGNSMYRLDMLWLEREELLSQKNQNLERIRELDELIQECQKMSRHYAIMIFLNDHDLEIYRRKSFVLDKGLRVNLVNIASIFYEKIKVRILENENIKFGNNRMYYQSKISEYEREKNELEGKNINISNRIFMINDELHDDYIDAKEKVMVRRQISDRYKVN